MLELYQSESCPECAPVRRRLAELGASHVVRTVPMARDRRERVVEAGGRPDIPLLLDPERGRTTYGVDEILEVLGADDLFRGGEGDEPTLPQLHEREGDEASDLARLVLDRAEVDYVAHPVRVAAAEPVPRLVEPKTGASHVGAEAIEAWARRRRPR